MHDHVTWIRVHYWLHPWTSFITSDKTLSSEKKDTKIIWFGSVVLILQPFLETQSFTNFVKSAQAIYGGYSSPQVTLSFVCTDQWASGQHCMEVRKAIVPDWNVLRMKRKLTMTMFWETTIESKLLNQFQWSWYHSFQKTMFHLMNSKYAIFLNYIRVTKIQRSAFLWHPVYFNVWKRYIHVEYQSNDVIKNIFSAFSWFFFLHISVEHDEKASTHQIWWESVHGGPRYGRMNT